MEGLIGGDRARRADARRDRELDKRLQQEYLRVSAASAPAAARPPVPAPAPATPRHRATSDVVEDGPARKSETRGVDERQGTATRRPAESAADSRSRKAARSTPQSDDSWSPNTKRYRGLPRGTTQADYSAWMRANRFPTAYSPDNPPPDDGDVDADGTDREDLLILSAIVRGVDPRRFIRRRGLPKYVVSIGLNLERVWT